VDLADGIKNLSFGARERNRTSTPLRALPPQGSLATVTTPAHIFIIAKIIRLLFLLLLSHLQCEIQLNAFYCEHL